MGISTRRGGQTNEIHKHVSILLDLKRFTFKNFAVIKFDLQVFFNSIWFIGAFLWLNIPIFTRKKNTWKFKCIYYVYEKKDTFSKTVDKEQK